MTDLTPANNAFPAPAKLAGHIPSGPRAKSAAAYGRPEKLQHPAGSIPQQMLGGDQELVGYANGQTGQKWRTVDRCPKYEVSDDGQVRRSVPGQGTRAGKILSTYLNGKGYVECQMRGEGGKHRLFRVHVLVAEAFLPPRPTPLHEVAHWDGDRSNPKIENLRWATRKENLADRNRHGTLLHGDTHPCSKLSSSQVLECRARRAAGEEYRAIGRLFGVSRMTVWYAVEGRNWARLEGHAASP